MPKIKICCNSLHKQNAAKHNSRAKEPNVRERKKEQIDFIKNQKLDNREEDSKKEREAARKENEQHNTENLNGNRQNMQRKQRRMREFRETIDTDQINDRRDERDELKEGVFKNIAMATNRAIEHEIARTQERVISNLHT